MIFTVPLVTAFILGKHFVVEGAIRLAAQAIMATEPIERPGAEPDARMARPQEFLAIRELRWVRHQVS
jgi:hypothetical protein